MCNHLIFLKVLIDCLVAYDIFYILFILLNDIFHERDPSHDFRNGMAGGQLIHLELPEEESKSQVLKFKPGAC